LSLRVKDAHGDGSGPGGGVTDGHTARHAPVQLETFAESPLDVYTGRFAAVTNAGPPSSVSVCRTDAAAAVGAIVGVACEALGVVLPPPPLHPATTTAPAKARMESVDVCMASPYGAFLSEV
jgi:hypothetical protein